MRAYRGTENGYVENMHKSLRYEHLDEFLYGSSNHNQRIEAWWSYLRNHNAQVWMSHFQALKNEDKFTGDFLDKNLLQLCFMNLIGEKKLSSRYKRTRGPWATSLTRENSSNQ